MLKKVFIFLTMPVLQYTFSPSVWNQNRVCSDWLAGRLCCDWSTVERCPISLSCAMCWSVADKSTSVTLWCHHVTEVNKGVQCRPFCSFPSPLLFPLYLSAPCISWSSNFPSHFNLHLSFLISIHPLSLPYSILRFTLPSLSIYLYITLSLSTLCWVSCSLSLWE